MTFTCHDQYFFSFLFLFYPPSDVIIKLKPPIPFAVSAYDTELVLSDAVSFVFRTARQHSPASGTMNQASTKPITGLSTGCGKRSVTGDKFRAMQAGGGKAMRLI